MDVWASKLVTPPTTRVAGCDCNLPLLILVAGEGLLPTVAFLRMDTLPKSKVSTVARILLFYIETSSESKLSPRFQHKKKQD